MIFRPQCKCTRANTQKKIIRSMKWINRKWKQTERVKAGILLLWEFSIFIFVDSTKIIGAQPCPVGGNAQAANSSEEQQYFISASPGLGTPSDDSRNPSSGCWVPALDELSVQPGWGCCCPLRGLSRSQLGSRPAAQVSTARSCLHSCWAAPAAPSKGPPSPALFLQLWSKASVQGRIRTGRVCFPWVLSHTNYFQLVSHTSFPWIL